jgi:single-stranded-DNA-specific exonuclease
VLEPRFRWAFPEPPVLPSDFRAAAERHGLSPRVAAILAARGVRDVAEIDAWFAEPEAGLHDPALLPDAVILHDRLARARRDGERILVFGDFDADGLTGLAILVLAFRRYGLEAQPYVPSRLDEGHGLSLAAIDAAVASGATVIVTVDCGTTSHAEIAIARDRGVDVIVTDHHRVPSVLPDACAVVNPHRADSTYPDRRLSGSGVAFKVASLLLDDVPGGRAAALDLADLATIGTVADVAPIVGENRAIARLGLERIRRTPRSGLAALLERSRIAPGDVDLEAVAYAIAPRLNAAGRVGEALDAALLLLADDPTEAARLAASLEEMNLARRDLTKAALDEARAARSAVNGASSDVPATIIRGPWSVGIVGLTAGRLAEEHGTPAVVGAELGSVIRASCRGDGILDLAAALETCADLFLRHGGHAAAAGFEIPTDRWDAFRERFLVLAADARPADPRATMRLDLAIAGREIDYDLHRELAALAPTGPGNPEPLIAVLGLTVTRVRAATGGHTQLTLRRERDVLDGIAFGRPDIAETVAEGATVDVVATLASRRFGGFESLQLVIVDAASTGHHPEATAIMAGRAAVPLGDAPSVAGVAS